MSPGNVAREGIPFELFRSTYPGRQVTRESNKPHHIILPTDKADPGYGQRGRLPRHQATRGHQIFWCSELFSRIEDDVVMIKCTSNMLE
ncbi:hypothetical protein Tco_1415370 [Tanacetum coccineum]